MLKSPSKKEVAIIDFGAAHVVSKGKMVQALQGTPEFVGQFLQNKVITVSTK